MTRGAPPVAVESFGRLDVVVNNAGYANIASVEDMTIADIREQLDTNLLGVINVTKAALPVCVRSPTSGGERSPSPPITTTRRLPNLIHSTSIAALRRI